MVYNLLVVKTRKAKRYATGEAQALLSRLVDFSEGSTAALVDRPRLRRLLLEVLESGPALVVGDARHEIQGVSGELSPWSPSKYAQFQTRLHDFFRGLVALAGSEDGGRVPTLRASRLTFGATPVRSDIVITVGGAATDVLLYQIVQLLQLTGVGRLRRCSNEECGHIFAKTGRREFCSNRCQKLIYMRARRLEERLERKRRLEDGKKKRARRR